MVPVASRPCAQDYFSSPAARAAGWRRIADILVRLPEERLATFDVAELNLGAAVGLPGTEQLDAVACRQKIDAWAELVRKSTDRWWPRFERSPQEFDNSPGRFRMLALVTVLQRDLGVRYNLPFSEGEYDARDPRNLFLQGVLSGHGGTCVTMPVLYIAVGRRLGYPLKLVQAKEHLFARWDDPQGERFNVECTSVGFVAQDDDYYRHHPKPLSTAEQTSGLFLQSLTARQTLAAFFKERGLCLLDNLRWREAMEAFDYAYQCFPRQPGGVALCETAYLFCYLLDRLGPGVSPLDTLSMPIGALPWPAARNEPQQWFLANTQEFLARIARNRRKLPLDHDAVFRNLGRESPETSRTFPRTTE